MTPVEQWVAFLTIARKETIRILRIWAQTLLPPAITMVLYFIIFGGVIGSQVRDIEGYDYMQFIVPGLVMMAVITNSYGNVVSSYFSAKFQRNMEEMLVSPTPQFVIIAGYVAGGMIRGLLVGGIVTLLAMGFTDLTLTHGVFTVVILLLTSMMFSLAGMTNGIFARKFDDVAIIPAFVLTPLTYLGGVFYSIKDLPDVLQKVSMANPILYMVNGFRYGILGVSDINPAVALGIVVAFTVTLFTVNLTLLRRGTGIRS